LPVLWRQFTGLGGVSANDFRQFLAGQWRARITKAIPPQPSGNFPAPPIRDQDWLEIPWWDDSGIGRFWPIPAELATASSNWKHLAFSRFS
jgi:hypothetical protein